MERIIGRKPTTGSDTDFLWLIKWDGYVSCFFAIVLTISPFMWMCSYPVTMAEWCPKENMGDCAKLVLKFNEGVTAEGLKIDTDQLILLEEAVKGGWYE